MLNVIESKDNAKIKLAYKLSQSSQFRRTNSLFFASTPKLVLDILNAGFEADMLFFAYEEYEKYKQVLEGQNVYIITDIVDEKLSQEKSSQGVYGIFKMKNININDVFKSNKILILQDVQDPNNIGAIMRTALAFGYKDVVITDKCADIYSSKVLRTSMSASVKLNTYKIADIAQFVLDLNSKGYTTVATCLENASYLNKTSFTGPLAICIGNEGNGLDSNVISNCTQRVKIPMSSEIESLNAAVSAAVIMWELANE